jgi:hypothetical protein
MNGESMEETSLVPVYDALDELRALLEATPDSPERLGLEAFIDCVAPQLVDGATMTYLGKIAKSTEIDLDMSAFSTPAEALEKLGDQFDVVLEPVA